MTVPYLPGGATQASAQQPAFTPRSLSTAGDPGNPAVVPRSHAQAGVPERAPFVPRTLGRAEAPPSFAGPDFGQSPAPGYAPQAPSGFIAPPLSHPAAAPGNYGLPSIAPNLFGGAPNAADHAPEPKPKNTRLFRFALWTAVIGLVLAGLSVLGVRLFMFASGMTVVPDLTAAEAHDRCESALVNEVNRGLEAALVADRRIKSNVLTGVEIGAAKAVDGGFDVPGTGRYTVKVAKKKAKPAKMLLTCQVRRDGGGQIVTTVLTKPAK
ncbi:hypothetical protein [Actinoplanes couchii]|uniref:Uncharacterized protein n=1 Tax=Actinoplanes couchii TaxID=403638 RepID=A0ABQ3X703_9ACTN|nr:hypothetical protein [Actinoplanes couchii]MDR6322112.1 hypothetical protein [Actinoplanes couchii]GID54277.1 hypothetical protein Aco03nite_026810 [Actinoplanes couchii]